MNRTNKVIATDQQIAFALARAKEFAPEDIRVTQATYSKSGDAFNLVLSNEAGIFIPRKWLQGLENAKLEQLSEIEILGNGTGLHWPKLDVSHYVLGLLNNVFGTKQWMARLGRQGGISRSRPKVEAARINGRKGGRPKATGHR
jgi:hypothetical protein